MNRTIAHLGDHEEEYQREKPPDAARIAASILAWDLFDEMETRDPFEFLAECKSTIERQVPRSAPAQMLGQILERYPRTKMCGIEIRKNAQNYPNLVQASAYVVSRLFAQTIQDSLREKFYYGLYESNKKNGPVATYCNRWYNILKNIRWGEIRGEADLVQKIHAKLPEQFRRVVGTRTLMTRAKLMAQVEEYEVNFELKEVVRETDKTQDYNSVGFLPRGKQEFETRLYKRKTSLS